MKKQSRTGKRIFYGVPISRPAALVWPEGLKKYARMNLTRPENDHITLRFLGEFPGWEAAADLLFELELPPCPLILNGPVVFMKKGHPAVLVLDVFSRELEEVKHQLDALLFRRLGIPPEKRKFEAHLTLGRISGVPDIELFNQAVSGIRMEAFSRRAEQCVLYESIRRPGGVRYAEISSKAFT